MQWYQMFEYAIGHWLQKATEHMMGCVLCRSVHRHGRVHLLKWSTLKYCHTLEIVFVHYI